jgi:hypothetical protein
MGIQQVVPLDMVFRSQRMKMFVLILSWVSHRVRNETSQKHQVQDEFM